MHQTRQVLALFLALACTPATALPDYYTDLWPQPGCVGGKRLVIDGVAYRSQAYMPLIHFRGHHWAYLSYNWGVNTVWGRSLLAVALTAYAMQLPVRLDCANGSDIRGIWIQDFLPTD